VPSRAPRPVSASWTWRSGDRGPARTLADPGAHIAVACDLCAVAEMESMFDDVRSFFGGLDVLVHVAGVLARTQVEDVTEEIWDWHLDNNLKATFFVDRAAARLMREGRKGGRIINFASDAWWTGGLHAATAYAASKGGVVSVSRGLAKAFARDGITVNCVAPGTVDSRMLRSGLSEEQIAHLADVIPLGVSRSPRTWRRRRCSSLPTTPASSPPRR